MEMVEKQLWSVVPKCDQCLRRRPGREHTLVGGRSRRKGVLAGVFKVMNKSASVKLMCIESSHICDIFVAWGCFLG